MMNETWKLHFYLPMTISVVCLGWLTDKFDVQEYKYMMNKINDIEVHGKL